MLYARGSSPRHGTIPPPLVPEYFTLFWLGFDMLPPPPLRSAADAALVASHVPFSAIY